MKYILIANNKNLTEGELENVPIKDRDIVVLFNNILPFFISRKIKYYGNKVVISRQSAGFFDRWKDGDRTLAPYAGLAVIAQNHHYFNQIIFHSSPDSFGAEKRDACLEYMKDHVIPAEKIAKLPPTPQAYSVKEEFEIPKEKGCSSGLLAYLAYKRLKGPADSLLLVGFTYSLTKKFHSSEAERKFFEREVRKGFCEIYKNP